MAEKWLNAFNALDGQYLHAWSTDPWEILQTSEIDGRGINMMRWTCAVTINQEPLHHHKLYTLHLPEKSLELSQHATSKDFPQMVLYVVETLYITALSSMVR